MATKFSFSDLKNKMKNNPEYLPFEIDIGGSIDTFLKIRESLTRIGRRQHSDGKEYLWQVCHIVQDEQTLKYYIVHFKHLYILSGLNKTTEWNDQDFNQLNYIVWKIKSWNLGSFNENITDVEHRCNISIIPFSKKKDVILRKKFFLNNKQGAIES